MSLFRLLFGFVGGAVLGLLYARQDGSKIRKKLEGKSTKEVAKILGEELLAVGKDVRSSAEEIAKSKKVEKAVSEGKRRVNTVAKKAKNVAKKVGEDLGKQFPKTAQALEEVVDAVQGKK